MPSWMRCLLSRRGLMTRVNLWASLSMDTGTRFPAESCRRRTRPTDSETESLSRSDPRGDQGSIRLEDRPEILQFQGTALYARGVLRRGLQVRPQHGALQLRPEPTDRWGR